MPSAVLFEEVRVAHVVVSGHAGNAVEAARGDEEHAPIGEIAGVVAVDVVESGRREELLLQGRVEARLEDTPALLGVESAGVGDLVRVKVEIHVAEEGFGIDEGLSLLARFAADGHGNDGVGIPPQRHGRVALPVVRQAGMRPPAALHEEVVREIDGGVAQIHVALELQDGRSRCVFRGIGLGGFHGRLHFCDTCEERGGIAVGLWIFFGIGADGALHRLGVEPLERFTREHRLVVNGRWRRRRRRRLRGVHLCHRLPGEFRALVLHEVHGQHKRTRVDERLATHDAGSGG